MKDVHVYHAIRRQKENEVIEGPRIIREVDSYRDPVAILKKATSDIPGVWRIYRSVNKRSVQKAELELIKTLIDRNINPGSQSNKPVGSLWKTILMQVRNKAERKYLLDIDNINSEIPAKVGQILGNKVLESHNTPNGYHLIVEPFDPRLFEGDWCDDITINKDGLLYLSRYEVK